MLTVTEIESIYPLLTVYIEDSIDYYTGWFRKEGRWFMESHGSWLLVEQIALEREIEDAVKTFESKGEKR